MEGVELEKDIKALAAIWAAMLEMSKKDEESSNKLNLRLTETQLQFIGLANHGLGISSRVGTELENIHPSLLYVLLQQLGFSEENLVASLPPPKEADLILLYNKYPDFDMLLTLGSIVLLMSDEEHQRFENALESVLFKFVQQNDIWSDPSSSNQNEDFTLGRKCFNYLHILYNSGLLRPHDLTNVSNSLDLAKCSKYQKHITEYKKRRSLVIAKKEPTKLQMALEKAMEEGYVSLDNIKMVICGPPCVGKTAFKDLLLNNPPPLKHNSTPITARPVKAIERIAAGIKIWIEVREEDLLKMLFETIHDTEIVYPPLLTEESYVNVDFDPHIKYSVLQSHVRDILSSPSALQSASSDTSKVEGVMMNVIRASYPSLAIPQPISNTSFEPAINSQPVSMDLPPAPLSPSPLTTIPQPASMDPSPIPQPASSDPSPIPASMDPSPIPQSASLYPSPIPASMDPSPIPQPASLDSSTIPENILQPTSAPFDVAAPQGIDYVSKKIIEHLSSPKRRDRSQKLHEATWIHLLDSGGQPQFTDLLRMFVRGNSIYIIVMKVTESLHEKPTFVYSIDGKPLNAPKEMTTTNLQIIESFVHSVAATSRDQLGDKSQPAIAIVATHCDQSRLRRWLGWEETLMEKNEKLLSCLSEFLDLFIFYDHDSNELIFPVDNLCEWNREKISADIRHRLLSTRSDISFSVKIPVRWYVFDLNMKEEASKESHGMISLQSCCTIGSKIGMDNSEVDQCLIYLDSMRLCIYYPNLLPHVVFTNPQFLIDSLSNIVHLSFVDDLQQILPEGVSLSDDVILSLKKDGVFEESLLITLGLTFIPCLFSKSNLLLLLKHFRVISVIKAPHTSPTRYFIPILLPAERLAEEQKTIFSQKIDPLLITFNRSIVIQGFFPTLIVSLLSREEEPYFFIDSRSDNFPRQLRHAVKLYSEDLFGSMFLCEEYKSIEIYFTGHPRHCYHLRKVILEGLSASTEILEYDEKKLKISALVHCTQKCHIKAANNDRPHSITFSDKHNPPLIGCSIEDLPVIELIDERQSCWLIDSFKCSSAVPICDVLPEGTILNQSHAPVILKALKELVDDWELLGLYLGIENHKLKEIKYDSHNQVAVCRKDMICLWLETGTATRESLILALVDAQRNDIAADINHLPTV